jgi:uncharacterized protein (TIGR02453 family)
MASPRFTPETLRFLKRLARNNDRDWFREHKHEYEEHVRGPMLAVVRQLAEDLPAFAPDLAADERRSIYRIYRDTRFSEDKTPLKTNIAASFPRRGAARHESAGLYLEVAPGWLWIGGGLYAPTPQGLYRVREHVAAHHRALRRIVTRPAFVRHVTELRGERLQRVPRGFAADHPAADYLRYKQFLAFRELPPDTATSPRFYGTLLDLFRAIAPLVQFLNDALDADGQSPSASKRTTRTTL